MVKVEQKNFEKAGIKASCKPGSSRDIPFDNKFDLIYTTLSFHHRLRRLCLPYGAPGR